MRLSFREWRCHRQSPRYTMAEQAGPWEGNYGERFMFYQVQPEECKDDLSIVVDGRGNREKRSQA